MKELKLGIIGMSEGNGHPYSWSAIFNGYSSEKMKSCGFPVIPEYLAKQNFPADRIKNARVTHIWTQDLKLSANISAATYIEHIVQRPEQMIGKIDALLLARDDAENHMKVAYPFILEGLPIYIDKPIAHTVKDLKNIFQIEKYSGQIFSCSALKFAEELLLSTSQKEQLGDIISIQAHVPNSWRKYAIHAVDPILANVAAFDHITNLKVQDVGPGRSGKAIKFVDDSQRIACEITATGLSDTPIKISYQGSKKTITTQFIDPYNSFKNALEVFIRDSVKGKKTYYSDIESAIKIVEFGI
jgi:hypothetical protein